MVTELTRKRYWPSHRRNPKVTYQVGRLAQRAYRPTRNQTDIVLQYQLAYTCQGGTQWTGSRP